MPPPIDWLSDARSKNEKDAPAEDLNERMTLFTPEAPSRRLADLVLSAETERQLRTALAKIQYHDVLYKEWGLESIHPEGRGIAINLYGPPGTGKSFAAEAIADHLSKKILRVDYAQIESRFVGDTPKNIVAAFNTAREADAVLFFDEADSMLSRRATNITQAADYGVNVSRSTLLLQLDSFQGVVLFATNLAANYDPAFVRRILAHVHFPLPDEAALIRLWRYHLPAKMPLAADVTAESLASRSLGLSGGDVLNTVILAAAAAVERGSTTVSLSDFEGAIDQVRRAKQEIGVSGVLEAEFRDKLAGNGLNS
ncbi:MAG: AAA family ATPase [Anaerolineae bacterium]|nr:26S protease regulatory subunit [Anaerolineae bacterium]